MILAATMFLSVAVVISLSAAHLIRLRIARVYPPTSQFSVAVIVPCKGNDDPDFENNLLSIVQQDYDGQLEFVFCVESEHDAALDILRQLDQRFERVRVCVAGLATHSAQKTYNILQGMHMVRETDIFVIADADIQPHPTWLKEIVAPFCDPQIGAATGFFRRVPISARFRLGNYLAGLFSAFIITGISDDRIKGLWGGSLAVRKSLMEEHNLYERLATEIVDDIVLMHALHTHNIKRRYVQSCTLKSYCDMSVSESIEWLIRQAQFSQIYFKRLYALYFLLGLPLVFSIAASPVLLLYGLAAQNWSAVAIVPGFLLLLALSSLLLYISTPVNPANNAPTDTPYRLLLWLLVTPVAFLYAARVLIQTLLRVKDGVLVMYWRSITYHVDIKTGKVIEVRRPPE
jgi:cellulose synthase/poly-beta-1,6-N-acetylglucosamine synthase-like glycosyltransferase